MAEHPEDLSVTCFTTFPNFSKGCFIWCKLVFRELGSNSNLRALGLKPKPGDYTKHFGFRISKDTKTL